MSETIEKKEYLEFTTEHREELSQGIETLAKGSELFGRGCDGLFFQAQNAISTINIAAQTMRIIYLLNAALAENSTVDFGKFIKINGSAFKVEIDPKTGIRRFVENDETNVPF